MKLAELLFPDVNYTANHYENLYPKRNLKDNAKVTRIAPSPTGFLHLGNLYSAMVNELIAVEDDGILYLRIEDTDNKREVQGAVDKIQKILKHFRINLNEGIEEIGNYGPYRQTERLEIYRTFAKRLVEKGLAYPCFCTEKQLSEMREKQKRYKLDFGYYLEWAIHRYMDFEEINNNISNKVPYVLRFRSDNNINKTFNFKDAIRGQMVIKENTQDFILLKSDGIPTYHFAHVIDDYLMGTTHVVRGEEWLPSLPMHIQLFNAFDWTPPVYCHTSHLMKMEGVSKRKLSKRKDLEASLEYYMLNGYDPCAVKEYLMSIINSNFEDWRLLNKDTSLKQFNFSIRKMSKSGSLFSLEKLNDVSKNIISKMPINEVYKNIKDWAEVYDLDFYRIFISNPNYSMDALSLCMEPPRKDIISWRQAKEYLSFFYDETFQIKERFPSNVSLRDRDLFLFKFSENYNYEDDNIIWISKLKGIAAELGYANSIKQYKKNLRAYKGHLGDLITILRISLVGRSQSPDLWRICNLLGERRIKKRLSKQNIVIK